MLVKIVNAREVLRHRQDGGLSRINLKRSVTDPMEQTPEKRIHLPCWHGANPISSFRKLSGKNPPFQDRENCRGGGVGGPSERFFSDAGSKEKTRMGRVLSRIGSKIASRLKSKTCSDITHLKSASPLCSSPTLIEINSHR